MPLPSSTLYPGSTTYPGTVLPQPPSSITLLALGRLSLPAIKSDFKEGIGAPLDTSGVGAALGQRRPKPFGFTIPLLAIPNGSTTDYVALANRWRRQLRSMLQNDTLRGQGLYLAFSVDGEINGWVIPGNGQIAYADGNVMFGNFELTFDEIYRIGTRWTHRPGLRFVNTDRRLATTPRDYLEQIFSTDFATFNAFPLNYLPPLVTDISASGAFQFTVPYATSGGAAAAWPLGVDSEVVSFNQPEAIRNLGQVVAYDRRGSITAPAFSPDPAWEEAYGPLYPWNWQTPGQAQDCPVLENGRCRIRYDNVANPGLCVDVWTGSGWAEQGKMIFARRGMLVNVDDTWQSASLVEYSHERAVMSIVLTASRAAASRETIYVTLQRGWEGPRIEVYPALRSDGILAGAQINWYDARGSETNSSALKIDATTTGFATAINSATLTAAPLGGALFNGENHWSLLGQGRAFETVGAVLQANAQAYVGSDVLGYGTVRNSVATLIDGAGYLSLQLGFPAQSPDQTLEAETIRVAGTPTQVTDATASGGLAVQDTQTSQAHNTLSKSATSLVVGATYRVIIRAKVDSGATGSFASYSGPNSSTITPTTTSTAWTWLDGGELVSTGSFQHNAWRSGGSSGSVYVDRVELFMVQGGGFYDGARDLGQIVLMDCRNIPTLVER